MAPRSITYSDDERYNWRGVDQLNQVLSAFQQAMSVRQEKQDRRAYENAELAIKSVERGADPADPAIRSALEPLRKRDPDLASIYEATLNAAAGERGKTARADAAYDRMVSQAEEQRKQMELLQMFGGAAAMGGNPMAGHALMDAGAMAKESVTTPMLLQQALQSMPVGEQLDALPQLGKRGVDMNMAAPSQFDPYGGDLPPDVAGLLAGQQGLITGDPVQALRYKTALDRSPQQLAAQQIAEQQLGLGARRQETAEARERRLASGGGGGAGTPAGAKREERARTTDQRRMVQQRMKEIRLDHLDQQRVLPTEERTPPPASGDLRQKAAREVGAALSPRLGAALDQMAAARAGAVQQIRATAGGALEGDKGAVQRNQQLAELVGAIDAAERDVLSDVARGKDPETIASLLEQLLQALQ